jgi:hypothetical protein
MNNPKEHLIPDPGEKSHVFRGMSTVIAKLYPYRHLTIDEIKRKVMSTNRFRNPINDAKEFYPLTTGVNDYVHHTNPPVVVKIDAKQPELTNLSKVLTKQDMALAFDKADPIIAMYKSELVRMITHFINYYNADDYSGVTTKQIDRRLDEYFENKT